MSLNFMLLFSTTVFVASIIPGPSMLLALTHGMHYGVKRTIASAMGNVTITLIQALISLAGLGTILFTSEIIVYRINRSQQRKFFKKNVLTSRLCDCWKPQGNNIFHRRLPTIY